MGVPTPNLFTGMQNIHGPLEWVSVQDMARATEMCIKLAQLWASAPSAGPGSKPPGERRVPAGTEDQVDWSG